MRKLALKETCEGRTTREKIRFNTSDRLAELVHTLEPLSFVPNCHEISKNYPTQIIVDLDAWWSITFEQLQSHLRQYCRFLQEHGITFFLTSSGGRGFHIYIPLSEWGDYSLILPRPQQFESLIRQRQHDLAFLAAHDAMEVVNIYYALSSPMRPIVPHSCVFDFEARADNILFDLRCGRNEGTRCIGSLHQRTLKVCRVWEVRNLPAQFRQFEAQCTPEYVIRDDLRCLSAPKIGNAARLENYRILRDLSWTHRHLIYSFFKQGYFRFFARYRTLEGEEYI